SFSRAPLHPFGARLRCGSLRSPPLRLTPKGWRQMEERQFTERLLHPHSNADGQFGIVDCMLLQPDGKILASGDGGLKRFNSNGTLDSSFNVAVNGMIWKMVQQLDGKILIVGEFTSVGGQPHVKLARIGSTP
ncbi:MAG TPA: hypothetical protein VFW05_16120, partial [Verrucomicrobiae bacterium]|nr:hypothetical protein [Verrucomicrobiae bacterium]